MTFLCNRDVINHGRRIPVGIQVIICSLEWSRSRPELVQDTRKVLRIGSYFGIDFGNGDVRDLHLLPSLSFIRFEYFVERLIKCLSR